MISKLSECVLIYLLKSEVISNDEVDFYKYGIEITISSLLNIVLVLFIGGVLGFFTESVVFLGIFILLRQFSGGYHAKTYLGCNTTFCAVFSMVIILHSLTIDTISLSLSTTLLLLCIIVITIKSPIENKNKPILGERKWIYRLMSTLITLALGLVSMILIYFRNNVGSIILYTLCAVTLLILVASISEHKERRVENEKEEQDSCDN